MAPLLGWFRAPPEPDLSATATCLSTGTESSPDLRTLPPEQGIHVAVDGAIRWRDADLATIARERGQPAALATAWRQHGAELAGLLGGHFALALIDPERNIVLLATDRMGTKPLCHARIGEQGFVFGSSAEGVRRHPAVRPHLRRQAIYDYVYFHVVPAAATIYEEVTKLERASVVVFDGRKASTHSWWTPQFSERSDAPVDTLARELQTTLRGAVGRCMAEAETAAFLSGGLDSSTVCGFHRELAGRPTVAYTIGFGAEGYDETKYARIAARHFGLELREHYVTADDVAASMRDIARAYDEPFGNSSAVPTLACVRRARSDGVRVMLAGDGGDEIFAGNERYSRQGLFEHYQRIPLPLRAGLIEPLVLGLPLSGWTPPTRKLRSYVEQARTPMPARLETYNFIHRMTPQALFEPEFLSHVDTGHPIAVMDASYGEAPATTLVDRMMYLDWKLTLADNDLRKVSRMCELAGIEVRYPMLDDALIDFSLQVPATLKLKGRALRYFYKRALAGFLPQAIIDKTKHGFGLPFGVWLASSTSLQSLVHDSLDALRFRGIVRADFLDQLLTSHRDEHAAYYGDLVWVLAMLELWLAEHAVGLA